MTDREAMKMALEALEYYRSGEDYQPTPASEAIHTLRQALVHTEQSVEPPDYVEPITFDYHDGWEEGFKAGVESIQNKKGLTPSNVSPVLHGGDKNYTELAQPEQEPVCDKDPYYCGYVRCQLGKVCKNTAPPKREQDTNEVCKKLCAQARRSERGACHQIVWDYGFSRIDNEEVQAACVYLAQAIRGRGKHE